MEGDNLNQKARYVRILFTAPYRHRWTVINELMINNGEYIPTVNDPTYISSSIEEKGFAPSNLRDGNLTTSYKPSTNNSEISEGSIIYRLSEKTDVRKVTIVQSGSSISNAKVMARVGDGSENVTDKWVQLGTLSNSLNEFINRDYNNIYEIKIEWTDVAPNIYEIITLNQEFEFPVNDSLKAKYDELINLSVDEYTLSSFETLKEALNEAKNILDDSNSSQKKIDKALNKAEEELALRATDFEDFNKVLNLGNSLFQEEYTAESWALFSEVLEVANEANKNKAYYTQNQINQIVSDLDASIKALVKEIPEVDKTNLGELINQGKSLLEESVEGFNVGEYHKGAKDGLTVEINKAEEVFNKEDATEEEINLAKESLEGAVARFNSLLIEESTGDFNGNGKIDIGDLAMISKNIRSTNNTSLDLNKDGSIDEY